MSSHRYLTDPTLSSAASLSRSSSNPISLLNQYGVRRTRDPVELRRLVLDYLCHQCFVDTAAAFARESASSASASTNTNTINLTTTATTATSSSSLNYSNNLSSSKASISNRTPKSLNKHSSSSSGSAAVKDHVIERTVRFDTDEDGDAEISDTNQKQGGSSSNRLTEQNPNANSESVSMNLDETDNSNSVTLNGSNSNHDQNGVDAQSNGSFGDRNNPSELGTASENGDYYQDWTPEDVQNTRIRLVIKEHILGGRVKEAIKLIETHFPEVLGPSLISKSGGDGSSSTSNPAQGGPSITTSSSNPTSLKSQRLKPNRVPFTHRPLSGPMLTPSSSHENIKPSSSARDLSPQPPINPISSQSLKLTDSNSGSSKNKINITSHTSNQFPHAMFGSLNPAHISLNLQIQFFVEFVRSISQHNHPNGNHQSEQQQHQSDENHLSSNMIDSPSSPSSNIANGKRAVSSPPNNDLSNSIGGLSDDTSTSSSTISNRTSSLALSLPHCRALYDYVHQLSQPIERAIFAKELENVAGLLAYLDPWNSPVKKYLNQSRRELLAERVNAAILVHLGRSPTSILQLVAQQASFTWSTLNELGEKISCPTDEDKTRTKSCNFFNFSEFISLCEVDDQSND